MEHLLPVLLHTTLVSLVVGSLQQRVTRRSSAAWADGTRLSSLVSKEPAREGDSTNSVRYLRSKVSMCLGRYLPLMTSLSLLSLTGAILHSVPNSTLMNSCTCSFYRFIAFTVSVKMTNTVFFEPSRITCGAAFGT